MKPLLFMIVNSVTNKGTALEHHSYVSNPISVNVSKYRLQISTELNIIILGALQ